MRSFLKKTKFFDELTAFKKITQYSKGQEIGKWVQDPSKRKEGNDCRRYAMAAMFHLGCLGEDLNELCNRLDSGNIGGDDDDE